MTRPRLTAKVLRGLSTVEAHAKADLEVMSGHRPGQERAWFNNREKKT